MWLTDRITSAVLLALTAFYVASGWNLDVWVKDAPGPGFMPSILALALAVLAIIIWVEARPCTKSGEEAESFSKREPILIFLLVLLYVFVMPRLGFLVSNFLLIVALRRMVEPGAWWLDLTGAVGATAIIHVVFVQIMRLQIPALPVWWRW